MRSQRIMLTIGVLMLVGLAAYWVGLPAPVTATVPRGMSKPIGSDPLTTQEIAAVLAAAGPAPAAASAESTQEILLVERHVGAKGQRNPARQGDLYIYDYATDTLIYSTVDIASGVVTAVERLQGVQLPLNANEEQRALDLIQADSALWNGLSERYAAITGAPLTQLSQLQTKVSVFHADVMPERLNEAAQQCGEHRCAQVLIFTVDKTLLELMPLVDLSQGQVVQVLDTLSAAE